MPTMNQEQKEHLDKYLELLQYHAQNLTKHYGDIEEHKFKCFCHPAHPDIAMYNIWLVGREIRYIRHNEHFNGQVEVCDRYSDVDWEKLDKAHDICNKFYNPGLNEFLSDPENLDYMYHIIKDDIPALEKAVSDLREKLTERE